MSFVICYIWLFILLWVDYRYVSTSVCKHTLFYVEVTDEMHTHPGKLNYKYICFQYSSISKIILEITIQALNKFIMFNKMFLKKSYVFYPYKFE